MLRDKSLIPLSHQHQHALALCVRIERASPIPSGDLPSWQIEIAELFQSEIAVHFGAEERILFPVAWEFGELHLLVEDLHRDHEWLRQQFSRAVAKTVSTDDLSALAQRLSAHIRKEERQLFEGLQERLSREQLFKLGEKLEAALRETSQVCLRPTEITKLRVKK